MRRGIIRLRALGRNLFLLSLAVAALAAACSRRTGAGELIVAGSTSIQPFADRWAEAYMARHPGRPVSVQGGGSSAGIRAARSGTAQIGTSSRDLKPDEKDLKEIVVARDGLAVIVHPRNPLGGLTLEQARHIFLGEIRNWIHIGGREGPITVVTREEGSGTRGAFQELVMGKLRIAKGAIVEDSNGTVREIVAGDPNAIGYISLGLVDDRVKALALDEVPASEENILAGRYKLVRPFLFVTNGEPGREAGPFIDFVLSPEGQKMIQLEGLIPAR
ncbi:MAG: phosphate ABC transporter substrate-binding protein [Acidobacteriota bacterium]|nr:phosphate ABC transporter substrate-binding protein [Acidobacteriota bacterium]